MLFTFDLSLQLRKVKEHLEGLFIPILLQTSGTSMQHKLTVKVILVIQVV